jgi:hypothetical protein
MVEDPLNYTILINRIARLFVITSPEKIRLFSKTDNGETEISQKDFDRIRLFLTTIVVSLNDDNAQFKL